MVEAVSWMVVAQHVGEPADITIDDPPFPDSKNGVLAVDLSLVHGSVEQGFPDLGEIGLAVKHGSATYTN